MPLEYVDIKGLGILVSAANNTTDNLDICFAQYFSQQLVLFHMFKIDLRMSFLWFEEFIVDVLSTAS